MHEEYCPHQQLSLGSLFGSPTYGRSHKITLCLSACPSISSDFSQELHSNFCSDFWHGNRSLEYLKTGLGLFPGKFIFAYF